ncbi:glycerophosphodiester phosphodiesterase [Halorientalis pallida]|uniref:Glycerophosphodiester phosphodiesterase n=1 Tax=Halorientalis pallida TaxID=2479928 RepID=A0A498L4N6_9EURY|nr:glycerophosphodiester phosphodiesterase [Halorientalis pallida]RXK51212.1 glycerophosphodiester phosphodiesterase [Halorientalis pallida]
MRCIAHRGFAETYPENTITAVRSAADHTDVVEIDVRRCGSGELVVIHDETIERVTDGQGRVDESSAGELAALDVLDSGEGVPTLPSLLDATPEGVELVLDLKERGVAADALDTADDAGIDVLVSAFSAEILEEASDAGADRLALLAAEGDEQGMLNVARNLGCEAIHPHWQLCVDEFVDRAHEAGLDVNAWTVPSRHDTEALSQVGVDGVVVDRPAVCGD